MRISVLICITVFAFHGLYAQTVIDVSDFGAKPDSFEDVVPAVKKAIAACKEGEVTTILFPEGRYDFWPEFAEERVYFISNTSSETECPSKMKKIGLLLENKSNITIEGNGSRFIFHGKMITFAFDHCKNIQLKNVSIDFERPSMSELRFETVSDTAIVAAVHPDSRYDIISNKLVFYGEGWTMHHYHAILVKPTQGTMFYSNWDPFLKSSATALSGNRVLFKGNFTGTHFVPGDVLTIRDPIRDEVGAFVNHSAHVSLRNVSLHYMHGLGIVSQFSEELHYDSIRIIPSRGRQIAAFADGMHFSGCRGNILVENCHFKGLHDDPVNVHGTHLQVTDIRSSNTVQVKFMHPQTYGFEAFFAGDSVGFTRSASLQTFGYGLVKSATLISEREMLIEFERDIPIGIQNGDCLENITWTPAFTIRNCRLEGTNTRGLLVTTRRKVLIENNIFYRTGMHAILIANDASGWFESGAVEDVTIRGNTFQECGYNSAPNSYTINIAPENHIRVQQFYVHRNIRIEDNVFKIYDRPVLAAKSVRGLLFQNNSIVKTAFLQVADNAKPSFKLAGSHKVNISKNSFTGIVPIIQLRDMHSSEITTDIRRVTTEQ